MCCTKKMLKKLRWRKVDLARARVVRKSACSFLVSMLVERERHFLYLDFKSECALNQNCVRIFAQNTFSPYRVVGGEEEETKRGDQP